ncbi:MAG: PilW family protein [Steroidobacterales bacterium]
MNNPTAPLSHRAPRCQGFTLVELLVSILLAVFLLGGVMTIVQDTRRASGSQTQSTQLQDSVRLAMTVLTDVIQTAGYYSDPLFSTPNASLPGAGVFAAGQSVSGTGAFNAASPGDTISVRFQTASGDGILNCGGTSNTSGANQVFVNAFSIDPQGDLQCVLTAGGVVAPAIVLIPAVTTATYPLTITRLQILYGVQTNFAAGNQCADSYLDATQVSAKTINGQTAWNYVVSVRITLYFSNPLGGADLPFTRVIGVMNKMGVVT